MPVLETLCIIPARGGSRGIPGKNLRPVAGTPLVGRAVEQALRARGVHRVVVSTEDVRIADVARWHGAEVVERPVELAGDEASSESALLHSLNVLEEAGNYRPDLVVFVQATSPLTRAADIDGTIEALVRADADCAVAVAPSHRFLWREAADGLAVAVNHDPSVRLRRQDREPEYVETGAVYVMRRDGFVHARHRFFGRIALHVTPAERYLEVDDPADLEHAEIAAHRLGVTERALRLPHPMGALVLDFDGVLTDNAVFVHQDGSEMVRCHRGDGMGLEQLRMAGVRVLVISKEQNPVVAARCSKLRIPCIQGIDDKFGALRNWAAENDVDLESVVFVGNDTNDAECLAGVGCGVIVSDAHHSLRGLATIQLSSPGGHGAVRELADMILARMGEQTPT